MADLLAERLKAIGDISLKKMFGGHGIFHKAKMFGIIDSKGRPYFKVNDSNAVDFEKSGAMKHGKMPYFSIPDSVLKDQKKLLEWATKALPK